jgi:hypothetical protein
VGVQRGDQRSTAHLLVDRVAIAKDDPAPDQASEKRICAAFLAFIETPLDEQDGLVEDDVFAQVECVLPGCPIDTPCL